jgi:hypothetical protein
VLYKYNDHVCIALFRLIMIITNISLFILGLTEVSIVAKRASGMGRVPNLYTYFTGMVMHECLLYNLYPFPEFSIEILVTALVKKITCFLLNCF